MPTSIDYDRELLAAAARRHSGAMPVQTSICLSAAEDELTDPLSLPALVDIDDRDTADLPAVIIAVRGRLIDAALTSATVTEAMTCARAARELLGALDGLREAQPGSGA